MNLHYDEVKKLTSNIIKGIGDNFNNSKIILCVPFIYIKTVQELLKKKENVFVGVQNCNENQVGAFTGEVSCSMLNSIGIKHVIIGHSERREYYYESDDIIKKKISQAINNNIIPIFCFGETLEARENKFYFNYVESQIEKSLFGLNSNQISNIILAYEPVWAIGTGRVPEIKEIEQMHKFIREKIKSKYDKLISQNISILYGGSVNSSNAKNIFNLPNVNGGLIGGASLNSDEFLRIVKELK
tara:strand:- start:11133 stop:11861 length:729 start_codon:yes stop_codon:yes gene_type:complete